MIKPILICLLIFIMFVVSCSTTIAQQGKLKSLLSQSPNQVPRVILIGLDAVGWQSFSSMLERALLPHLESIVNAGVVGKLTNFPGGQKQQWGTIATGLRPIFIDARGWWLDPLKDDNAKKRKRIAAFQPVQAVPLWEILSSVGIKVGASGWQIGAQGHIDGYEAKFFALGRRNGIPAGASQEILFDQKSAPNWVATTYAVKETGLFYPNEFFTILKEDIVAAENKDDNYFFDIVPSLKSIANKNLYLDLKYALVSTILSKNIGKTLISDHELNFVGSIIWGLDIVRHRADEFENNQLFEESFQFVDTSIGEMLNAAAKNTYFFVVSNHAVERKREHNKHSTDAIFIAQGPGIKRNKLVVGASIADVAPTILRLFGIEIEDSLDGRPMTSIFSKSFLKHNPVSSRVSLSKLLGASKGKSKNPINKTAIENANLDRMRKIGYFKDPTNNAPLKKKE